jgi:general L-amino acid transport system substrate-binding protein
MIDAEELGISSANVDEQLKSSNPEIKRFLGVEDDFGKGLGLTKDWAYRIVKKVGNYGEAYDRNFGPKTRINIPRGLNNLWTQGGLQYAPPVR